MGMRDRARAAAEAERVAKRKAEEREAAERATAERRHLEAEFRRWAPGTKKNIKAWAKNRR
jgi:hypothetical protein